MSKYKKKNGIKGESLIYEMKKMKLTNYKKKNQNQINRTSADRKYSYKYLQGYNSIVLS